MTNAAAGTVTLGSSESAGNIDGASTVRLTDTDRGSDVRVDIWQGGEAVQENIGWTSGKIDISGLGLAAGDYQLKLSIADGTGNRSALSYKLVIPTSE